MNKLEQITLQLLENKLKSLLAQSKALSEEIASVVQAMEVIRESASEESSNQLPCQFPNAAIAPSMMYPQPEQTEAIPHDFTPEDHPILENASDEETEDIVTVIPGTLLHKSKPKKQKKKSYRTIKEINRDIQSLVEFLESGPKSVREIMTHFNCRNLIQTHRLFLDKARKRKLVVQSMQGHNRYVYSLVEKQTPGVAI